MSHGSVLIGTSEIRSQAQESGRYTPDPFPRERVGSGNETSAIQCTGAHVHIRADHVTLSIRSARQRNIASSPGSPNLFNVAREKRGSLVSQVT